MFHRFSELPADTRRQIWLATLGPMTLAFTDQQEPPKDDEEAEVSAWRSDPDLDLTGLPQEEVDYYLRPPSPPLFANFRRYYGHVALPDGMRRMLFTVKSSVAYLACKESRDSLRFKFAEPPGPGGGPIVYEINNYIGFWHEDESSMDGKDHNWVRQHLTSLQDLTFEMMFTLTYEYGGSHWLRPWFPLFEGWYNSKYGDDTPPFWTRVISYQEGTFEDEWLTPENYLLMKKMVLRKRIEAYAPRMEDWGLYLTEKWDFSIYEASAHELRNVAKFLEKNRPLWDE